MIQLIVTQLLGILQKIYDQLFHIEQLDAQIVFILSLQPELLRDCLCDQLLIQLHDFGQRLMIQDLFQQDTDAGGHIHRLTLCQHRDPLILYSVYTERYLNVMLQLPGMHIPCDIRGKECVIYLDILLPRFPQTGFMCADDGTADADLFRKLMLVESKQLSVLFYGKTDADR